MYKQLILISSLLILSIMAQADFNWQLDADYEELEHRFDSDADIKFETNDFKGTYYFSPVVVAQSPIREAAFLNKHSNIHLQYITDERSALKMVDDDRDNILVNADIRIAQTSFRVGGFIGSVDEAYTGYDYSALQLGLTFGWHIRDMSLLFVKLHAEKGENDKSSGKFDEQRSMFEVGYKQVISLRNSSLAFGGDFGFAHVREDLNVTDDYTSNEASLNGFITWYVTPKFGFGGELRSHAIYSYTYNQHTQSGRVRDVNMNGILAFTASYDVNEYIGFNTALGWGDGIRKRKSNRNNRTYDIHILTASIQARF